MAKKKKRRRSYKRKAKRSSGPKAKPIGLAGGFTLSGVEMATDSSYGGIPLVTRVVGVVKGTDSLANVANASKQAVTDMSNYKYAALGLIISASPRIPLVNILAKPADRGLKRLTKGKWGL